MNLLKEIYRINELIQISEGLVKSVDERREDFIKNSKDKFGDRFDYSLMNYVTGKRPIQLKCIKHNKVFNVIPNNHLKPSHGGGCPLCKDNKYDDFIEKSKKKFGEGSFYYDIDSFNGIDSEMKMTCLQHENPFEFVSEPSTHLRSSVGDCDRCREEKEKEEIENKIKRKEEFFIKSKKVWGDEFNNFEIGEFTAIGKPAEMKCKKHNQVFFQRPSDFERGRNACGACKLENEKQILSLGEGKVVKSLRQLNFYSVYDNIPDGIEPAGFFEYNKTFVGCVSLPRETKSRCGPLKFDFFIPEIKTFIEFDGEQHFDPNSFKRKKNQETNLFKFEDVIENDLLKNAYAKKNDIKMIRIFKNSIKSLEDLTENIKKAFEKKEKFILLAEGQYPKLGWNSPNLKTNFPTTHNRIKKNKNKFLKEETNIIAKRLIKKIFDNVFNKLNLIPKDEQLLMDWVDEDGKKIFQRNWWGKFWVDDCEVYKNLYSKTLFLSSDIDEFETNLLEYLNTKYEKEFKDRPLKEIGDEYSCLEDD